MVPNKWVCAPLLLFVVVVVIHYKLIYISSIIGDVYRYSRLATIQLLVY